MTKQDITYQDKLNELKLDISHPNSNGLAFILVEGESDIRLFRKFFNLNNCKVEKIPGGKNKLEICVEEVLQTYEFVIGIRDADFLNIDNEDYNKTNMFLTDNHDIEMTLISKDSIFNAIILEFTNFPSEQASIIRSNIIKSIEKISLLKWLNEIEDLKIKFEKTNFQDIISFITLEVDFDQYFNRLMSKSVNAKITDINIIKNKLSELALRNPEPFQLCNGHDFIKALSQFLRLNGKVNNINDDIISSIFRIKCSLNEFSSTKIFNSTKEWAENKNINMF